MRIAAKEAFKIGSDSLAFADAGRSDRTSRTILCHSTPTFAKKLPPAGLETGFLSNFTPAFGGGTLLTSAATAGGGVVAELEAVGAIGFWACNGGSAANFFPPFPKFPIETIKALIFSFMGTALLAFLAVLRVAADFAGESTSGVGDGDGSGVGWFSGSSDIFSALERYKYI